VTEEVFVSKVLFVFILVTKSSHVEMYLINSNVLQLLTDLPPGGFILGFLKPTEILLNVA
jgi:hypothetical protein